ncbi:hypothetical protein ES705_00645 [subsurface metagenome]
MRFTVLIILIGVGCKEEGAEATAKDKIAFMSDRDGNWEIYIMNIDGSGQINLTNDPARDEHPSFSPLGILLTGNL